MIPWNEFAAAAEQLSGNRWKTRTARQLRRSPSTIRRWQKQGYVPESDEGEVRHLLGMQQPRSQSDLVAEVFIKAFGIRMIG